MRGLNYVGAIAIGASMVTLTTAAALFAQSSWDDVQQTPGTVRAIFCDIGVATDDSDADTLTNEAEISLGTNPCSADTDEDGCSDDREVAAKSEAATGGGRDPLDFWDFMDVWTAEPPVRDKVVSVGDIGALVARFSTSHKPPLTEEAALAEALTPPTDLTSYHAAFDRAGSDPEGNPWNLFPPDGVISAGDIGAVVVQFGHSCAGPP